MQVRQPILHRKVKRKLSPTTHTLMSMDATTKSIPLSDGNSIPLIGLGTYGDPRTVRQIEPGILEFLNRPTRHSNNVWIYQSVVFFVSPPF